jgi:hypothetical protein
MKRTTQKQKYDRTIMILSTTIFIYLFLAHCWWLETSSKKGLQVDLSFETYSFETLIIGWKATTATATTSRSG